jgi:hypothetical protein
MKLQNEATITAKLNNEAMVQMQAIIDKISDPIQKATLYKKVFGTCCDTPQGCTCHPIINP